MLKFRSNNCIFNFYSYTHVCCFFINVFTFGGFTLHALPFRIFPYLTTIVGVNFKCAVLYRHTIILRNFGWDVRLYRVGYKRECYWYGRGKRHLNYISLTPTKDKSRSRGINPPLIRDSYCFSARFSVFYCYCIEWRGCKSVLEFMRTLSRLISSS